MRYHPTIVSKLYNVQFPSPLCVNSMTITDFSMLIQFYNSARMFFRHGKEGHRSRKGSLMI